MAAPSCAGKCGADGEDAALLHSVGEPGRVERDDDLGAAGGGGVRERGRAERHRACQRDENPPSQAGNGTDPAREAGLQ